MSQPHRSIIKNVGKNINTSFPEYVPLITPDETILYFTSKREGGVGNAIDGDGSYYEDIYMSQKEADGNWGIPKNIGAPINTKSNDACVALSFDGNQLIIYRTSPDLLTGDLYISRMGFNGWEAPTKLGAENPSGKNKWFEHPDGHPDAGQVGIPSHHNSGHIHAVNAKGEEKIFTW